jgi:hypothetical protein
VTARKIRKSAIVLQTIANVFAASARFSIALATGGEIVVDLVDAQ